MGTQWNINEKSFAPDLKKIRSQESVYTIGNGYFCTRGTFEEGYPGETSATLLYGLFDRVPIAKEELANIPDWTELKLFVDGERFRLDQGQVLEYQRNLDMLGGILQRSVLWESPAGTRVRINTERFASLADEHVGAISYSVSVENKEAEVSLYANFNTAQGNYDLLHVDPIDQGQTEDLLWLHTATKHSAVQIAQTMSFTVDIPTFEKTFIDSDVAPGIHFTGRLAAGTTCRAEKIVTIYTSRDGVDDVVHTALEHHAEINRESSANLRYAHLQAPHREAWLNFWRTGDVILEGDEKAQRGVRYSVYQLRINASTHDDRYSVAAKGMTGFGYRGHIFHDTEIFMLPFYTYVMPEIARNLLLYRYHLLPAAREKAASSGGVGAQYPWESTLDGTETTPPAIIHPETGELIPVLNGTLELHITSSIAHAVWEYWRVTGDDEFLREYGAEILLSTAQFWAGRFEKNPEHDDYEINNVIGPDEWHEHVNNNAHTNYMAKRNIQTALQTWVWLKTTAPDKAHSLLQKLGLTDQDLDNWTRMVKKIRFPQDPHSGLIEQFDGFLKLKQFDKHKYLGRKDSYQGLLGITEVQKYQIIKQADVLMLLTVLNNEFDLKTKRVNWDYYFPLTDNEYGSSLTPALHVILASELGLADEGYKLFMSGALVDIENLRGNTPEGIHAACAGAVWQAAILGFAGLRINEEGYTTNPHLPAGWTRLAFNFKYKGETVCIDLHAEG